MDKTEQKVLIFEEVLFFKPRATTTTTEKQTIDSTYLVSVGCRRLAEGKGHKTDVKTLPINSAVEFSSVQKGI